MFLFWSQTVSLMNDNAWTLVTDPGVQWESMIRMRSRIVIIFVFILGGLLGNMLSELLRGDPYFEANRLAYYIYQNGNFENRNAKEIFSDGQSDWKEICHNLHMNTETIENIEMRHGPFGDDEIFYELTRLVLKDDNRAIALFFDKRFFAFESDIECQPIDSVFITATQGDTTVVKLKVNK